MTYLPDSQQVYFNWRDLVITHDVRGVQVHDARLAAIMRAHGVTRILTLNESDFLRYAGIQAVHPNQVHSSPR
jgi:predicted nucleic acid-binding protein